MAAKKKPSSKTQGTKPRSPNLGTKRKILDYKMIQGLARVGCTDLDIECVLGYSRGALSHRKKVDPALVEALETGHAEMRTSIRRAQYKKGVTDGHPGMLIWLGKQHLGQREPPYNVDIQAGVNVIDDVARKAGLDPEAVRREFELIAGAAGCKVRN